MRLGNTSIKKNQYFCAVCHHKKNTHEVYIQKGSALHFRFIYSPHFLCPSGHGLLVCGAAHHAQSCRQAHQALHFNIRECRHGNRNSTCTRQCHYCDPQCASKLLSILRVSRKFRIGIIQFRMQSQCDIQLRFVYTLYGESQRLHFGSSKQQ